MKTLPRVAQTLDYTCGAACFDSMFQYFNGTSPGELFFANALGTLTLGYTPPINIVNLARNYGFICELTEGEKIEALAYYLSQGCVTFVTWWDEDAGHYSLVKQLASEYIVLMDPWLAREDLDNLMTLQKFIPHWNARGNKIIRVSPNPLHPSKISR